MNKMMLQLGLCHNNHENKEKIRKKTDITGTFSDTSRQFPVTQECTVNTDAKLETVVQ